MSEITIEAIERAAERIDDSDIVRETPIDRSRSLSDRCGGHVLLKMEHLQRTGSFKPRGAYNTLCTLGDGIDHAVAASAGNHAQGVAIAADSLGLDSTIVMPRTAPQMKAEATRSYGAEVVLEGDTFRAAMDHAETLTDAPGSALIHAFDDPGIVAGQGTLGLEIYEQVPDLDTVVVPVGGGGLIAGVATAIKAIDPDVRVVGVQAEGAATGPESLLQGTPVTVVDPRTIADGIATGRLSERTLDCIERSVDEFVVVDDDAIAAAILFLLERAKQMVEGAGAVGVAALVSDALDVEGETVVPVLSGGNIDITSLQEVLTHALADRRQLVELTVRIDDRPGKMGEISTIIGDRDANIRTVRHERGRPEISIGDADLVFEIETNGRAHSERVIDALRSHSFDVRWSEADR